MRTISTKYNIIVRQFVEQIVESGQITRQEHLDLTTMLLSEQQMTDEDRCRINRVFDYIQSGRLKLVN
jgi:hypothetical protein